MAQFPPSTLVAQASRLWQHTGGTPVLRFDDLPTLVAQASRLWQHTGGTPVLRFDDLPGEADGHGLAGTGLLLQQVELLSCLDQAQARLLPLPHDGRAA